MEKCYLIFCKKKKNLPINSQFLVPKKEKCSNRKWINDRNSILHFTEGNENSTE